MTHLQGFVVLSLWKKDGESAPVCGLVGGAVAPGRDLVEQILEQDESLWFRIGCRLDQRGRDAEVAQLLGTKNKSWLRAAVVGIEYSQVNQRSVPFAVCRRTRVVDRHDGVLHLIHLPMP